MKNFFFIFLFIFFFITCDSCFSKSNNFFSSDLYIIKSVNFVNFKLLSNNYLFSDVKFYKGDVINFSEDFINYSIKKLLRNNIIESVNIYVLSVLNSINSKFKKKSPM